MYEDLESVARLKFAAALDAIGNEYQQDFVRKSAELAARGLANSGAMQQAKLDLVVAAGEKRCKAESTIWLDLILKRDRGFTRDSIDFIKARVAGAGQAVKNNATSVVDGWALADCTNKMDGIVAGIQRDLEIGFQEQELVKPKVARAQMDLATSETDVGKARRVWVVHGRDERLRRGIFDFLRSIGLEPMEFSEARKRTGKPMPYVGEILEAAFRHAQAVVVLLSPDDDARLRPDLLKATDPEYEKVLTGQARPNVLFEAGMALSSHPDRTILVQVGNVRPFSDVAGRHIVYMDGSTPKRQELASRLEDARCPVNLEGTDWHTAGDLASPIGNQHSANLRDEKVKAASETDSRSTAPRPGGAGLTRDPYAEDLERTAKQVLDEMTYQGWLLLRHLLLHEPIEVGGPFLDVVSADATNAQMTIALNRGLVRHTVTRQGAMTWTHYVVNQQFRPVLERVLYERLAQHQKAEPST